MLAVYFYAYGSFTSKAAAFSGIGKAVEYYRILLCPLTCKDAICNPSARSGKGINY